VTSPTAPLDGSVSHPEKVLFPDCGITKGELCGYYEAVALAMLPHVRGRPVTMERYPAGIDKPGFVQKDVVKGFPSWLERVAVPKRDAKGKEQDGAVHYPLAGDSRSLVWLANQNCITPHVWTARVPRLDQPDLCLFDLDPASDDQRELHAAALAVRDLLDELGLVSLVKTSGSKGFHVAVPLQEGASFLDVRRFAIGAGAVLVKRHPSFFTQEFIKADRGGRIFVDTARNGAGATFAAAYAVRARPGAPISAPCTWQEIERGSVTPRSFTLRTMRERLDEVGELWRGLEDRRQSLRASQGALEALLTAEEWSEAWAASTRRPVSRSRGSQASRPPRARRKGP
jgi:bifunctional non-homologous end joining protein LigD